MQILELIMPLFSFYTLFKTQIQGVQKDTLWHEIG